LPRRQAKKRPAPAWGVWARCEMSALICDHVAAGDISPMDFDFGHWAIRLLVGSIENK